MHRLLAAVRKEFIQFSRDRLLIFLILWTYTVEVVLCAYALSFDVTNLSFAIYDQDRSQLSQQLLERFTSSEYFGKTFWVFDSTEIDRLLDSGEADLAIAIPPGFSDDLRKGDQAEVQILLSGTNSNTANAAWGYASTILSHFSKETLLHRMAKEGRLARVPEVEPRIRIWYNPELEFRYFMVISMIVIAALLVGTIHIAATLVREKETGTIEQIMVTPLRKHEIILSKIAPTLTIGLLSLFPSLAIVWWFGVPVKGSITLFFLASAIALLSSMGIGTYISTLSRNLQQALLMSFFVLFPLMFLSGTLIPIESMPRFLQHLSRISPIRYYMEIALGIFLKGVGFRILWPEFLQLFAFGAVLFPLSLYRLRKRIYA